MEYDENKVLDKIQKHKRLTQKELYKITLYWELNTTYLKEHKRYIEVQTVISIYKNKYLCKYRQKTSGKNEGHTYHFNQLKRYDSKRK